MPSSHSGSSHSSSSHSSGGFSSHSSGGFSSHSSGGFSSHSSSSHSSSWGSSGSFGGVFGSSRSSRSSSGPSRHSASSASGTVYRSHYVRSGSMRGTIIDRQRYNQPRGYVAREHNNLAPFPHYCVRHNYLYYPYGWTDEATGQEYKKGYYDENGQYYEDVAFLQDGKYKNVLCQCEYCDTITKIDWSEGGPLICPQCGGTLKILSALDEYTRDPLYEKNSRNADYVDYADRAAPASYGGSYDSGETFKGLIGVVILIVAFLVGFAALTLGQNRQSIVDEPYHYGDYDPGHPAEDGWVYLGNGSWAQYLPWDGDPDPWENDGQGGSADPAPWGQPLYLNEAGPGEYAVAKDADCSRTLYWDEDAESWYDPDSELWVWYNTEVDPPLWQYWYEPISGDYGDYGWMEYEDGLWFIEADEGEWIEVPDGYDTSALWYISSGPYGAEGELLEGSEPPIPGEPVWLFVREPGCYTPCIEDVAEKTLQWSWEEQSWYDEETGLWLWYNTDVYPSLWQYWYEPISGDYGDYGWMEYEDGVWYIEADEGEWIEVPDRYDTSELWYIDMSAVG